jgi:GTP-binding protein EngB required for normal cell division
MSQLPIRTLLALGTTLAVLVLLILLLFVSNLVLSLWGHLQDVPVGIGVGLFFALMLIGAGGGWLAWRVLRPTQRQQRPTKALQKPVIKEVEVRSRLESASERGVDIQALRQELAELGKRREAGEIYIAFLGNISSGKSSLIRALLPEAEIEIDPRGGTTRQVDHYVWQDPSGDRLVLTDMPGLDAAGQPDHTVLAREEALRTHIVVYVCEGDLTRDQYLDIQALVAMEKPMLVAFNKADLYSESDLQRIIQRLEERVGAMPRVTPVAISAGGTREVIRVYPDGTEKVELRTVPPKLDGLRQALQRVIDADAELLDELRDSAVFALVSHKLDASVVGHQRQKAEELVSQYSRKAIIGAMAAWTPGSDLIIQGYLGIHMIKDLCALYDVPAKEIDVKKFIRLAGRHVGKSTTLLLALAGNALKAFPGVGTLAGGVLQAVAYGLIFQSLGKSAAKTLETRGTFLPDSALRLFEETLSEDLETRARKLAKIALEARRDPAASG